MVVAFRQMEDKEGCVQMGYMVRYVQKRAYKRARTYAPIGMAKLCAVDGGWPTVNGG